MKIEYATLISGIVDIVELDAGTRVLRVCWYDGAKDGRPTQDQQSIGLLPRTKIRIGRLNYAGEQKGVDLRLGLDMVTNAQRRVADVAYLVSGDDDLAEAVEEAQSFGTQVALLGVPADNALGVAATALNLALTADRIVPLPPELLQNSMIRVIRSAPTADPSRDTEDAIPGDSVPALAAKNHAATPSNALTTPGYSSRVVPAAPAQQRPPGGLNGLARSIPVYSSTTGVTPPSASAIDEPDWLDDVAQKLVSAWYLTASPGDVKCLRDNRPQIPPELDRILLQDGASASGQFDLPTEMRFALREAFWIVFDRVTKTK